MRIILLYELTRLEAEVAREGTIDSVRRNYDLEVFKSDLESPHQQYQIELSTIRQILAREGRGVVDCLRHEAQSFVFRSDDLIVIHGDDGAFVNVAKLLTSQRVITIRTATKHCGRLMKFDVDGFRSMAKKLIAGEHGVIHVSIARAETSLGHSLEAVNDFFVGRSDLRSSRYAICVDEFIEQISSGVIIATGTGSTGWEKSARRHDEEYVERDPDDTTLSVITRELCHGEDLGVLDDMEEIILRSHDNETRVVADGVIHDAGMLRLPAGATVTINSAVRSIALCV